MTRLRLLALFLSAAVVWTALGPQSAQAANGCERERGARSLSGTEATKIFFNNQASERVRVYWVDYEGRRKFYSEVEPGDSYTQDTYMTHPWVVTDTREHCIMLFRPAPGATLATIHD